MTFLRTSAIVGSSKSNLETLTYPRPEHQTLGKPPNATLLKQIDCA
jgi:hypothetical protein